MTELFEPVSLAKLDHSDHDEETCAFCKEPQKPTTENNDLIDSFNEDINEIPGLMDEGMAHKNCAGTLGTNLEGNGQTQIEISVTLTGWTPVLPVQSAAHHILPGYGSVRPSKIMKFLHVQGMAQGNIGYDVNNYENGVWLVGNYALRGKDDLPGWGAKGTSFTTKTGIAPYEYAKAAITKTNRQFHDAHSDYNNKVLEALDLIAKKFELTQDVWCEHAKKPDKPEDQQLFMLVNRLNTTSRRLKSMLTNPGKKWKRDLYTSDFSRMYIGAEIYK